MSSKSSKAAPTVYVRPAMMEFVFGQTRYSVRSSGDEDDNDERDGTSDIVDSSSVFEAFSKAFASSG
jgi:hypothetical protein